MKTRSARLCLAVLALGLMSSCGPQGPELVYSSALDDLEDIPKLEFQELHLVDDVSFDGGKSIHVINIGLSNALLRELTTEAALRDDVVLSYRIRVKTQDILGSVYPDLRVKLPGRGTFAAAVTREDVLRGTNDWTEMERRFVLAPGEVPELIHLNFTILGRGLVWIDDLRLFVEPRKPEEASSARPEHME